MRKQKLIKKKKEQHKEPLAREFLEEESGLFLYLKLGYLTFLSLLPFIPFVYLGSLFLPAEETRGFLPNFLHFLYIPYILFLAIPSVMLYIVIGAQKIASLILNAFQHKRRLKTLWLLFLQLFSGPLIALFFGETILGYFLSLAVIDFTVVAIVAGWSLFYAFRDIKFSKRHFFWFLGYFYLLGLPMVLFNWIGITYFFKFSISNFSLVLFFSSWFGTIFWQIYEFIVLSQRYEEKDE